MMSLIPTGTPWSGPMARPDAMAASSARAWARAPPSSTVTQARRYPSDEAIRSSAASTIAATVVAPSTIDRRTSTAPSSVRSSGVVMVGSLGTAGARRAGGVTPPAG